MLRSSEIKSSGYLLLLTGKRGWAEAQTRRGQGSRGEEPTVGEEQAMQNRLWGRGCAEQTVEAETHKHDEEKYCKIGAINIMYTYFYSIKILYSFYCRGNFFTLT